VPQVRLKIQFRGCRACKNFTGHHPFRGGYPKFCDLDYKVHRDSNHVAKFHGDRPSELGDLAAKEIKTSAVKHKAFRNYRSGWPKNAYSFFSLPSQPKLQLYLIFSRPY